MARKLCPAAPPGIYALPDLVRRLGMRRPRGVSRSDYETSEVTIYRDGSAAYTDGGVRVRVDRDLANALRRCRNRSR